MHLISTSSVIFDYIIPSGKHEPQRDGGPPLAVEGECGTLKFAIIFCFRILPQSPTVPAPSRKEPSSHHLPKAPFKPPCGGRGTAFGGGRRVRKLKIRCYTQVTHSPSISHLLDRSRCGSGTLGDRSPLGASHGSVRAVKRTSRQWMSSYKRVCTYI